MNLAKSFQEVQVNDQELGICWLGQAGFLLKDSSGTQLVIDPYLTNCGERLRGFKRLSPTLLEPKNLGVRYYVTTHAHFDHFDYDTIPVVAGNTPEAVFFGPSSCITEFDKLGIPEARRKRMDAGSEYQDENVRICATWADHGIMAPDAIGALIWMNGHCLYFSGDTAFHEELFRTVASYQPEMSFLSVNGAFGNMTADTGAVAAEKIGSKYAVPCHHWTFREHHGDPGEFCQKLDGGKCKAVCFRQGEILILDQDGILRQPEGSQL